VVEPRTSYMQTRGWLGVCCRWTCPRHR